MLGDEQYLLKGHVSANCGMDVMTGKMAAKRGNIINIVTGLYQGTVPLYNFTYRNVVEALVAVSRRLKEVLDSEAQNLQQSCL